jgi:hypothetical protein
LEAVRASIKSLSAREREEVDLIDAKIDVRAGSRDNPEPLLKAKRKLEKFLRTARTPALRSEARGWVAHIHYLLEHQTEAGKIYLDELRRRDSNLSRQTLLNSLRMTYGYDGGEQLLEHLESYFDTPEHAAFAISLVTNPKWNRYRERLPNRNEEQVVEESPPYERISGLLTKHRGLFVTTRGADVLAELGMRTALRAADPKAAIAIAAAVPATAEVRKSPDFLWMLGAARFLSRDYVGAEEPLVTLHKSRAASESQRAAAAYGLCGVYFKTGNWVEQVRMALWLRSADEKGAWATGTAGLITDMSVYWAASGFDLGMLLDAEVPVEALRDFLDKYPAVGRVDLVQYSLAVRLAREEQYAESAALYTKVRASARAARMRQLAALKEAAERNDSPLEDRLMAKFRMAELLAAHSTGVYFNDKLWSGLQRYALFADQESRLTRIERERLRAAERHLKDQQEEYWRAYLLLREVVDESGQTALGRRAAQLAVRCLRRISTDRFGREKEIAAADVELTRWLRSSG